MDFVVNAENTLENVSNIAANNKPSGGTGKPMNKTPSNKVQNVGTKTPRPETPSNVTQAREAARLAKLQSTAERVERVAAQKEKWAKEKAAKLKNFHDKRKQDIHRTQMVSKVISESRQRNLQKRRQDMQTAKQARIDMLASKNETNRLLAEELERKAKARRRQSIMLNDEIKTRAVANAQRIAQEQLMLAQSDHELRRLGDLDMKAARQKDEENRRQSMAMRGEKSRKDSKTAIQLASHAAAAEASLLEYRRDAWLSDREHAEAAKQAERDEMTRRINAWKEQQHKQQQLVETDKQEIKGQLQSAAEGWQDVNAYKAREADNRRQSMAGRVDKWKDDKAIETAISAEQQEAENISMELRSAAWKDEQAYKKKLQMDRRASMASRVEKAKVDADWERGQATLMALAVEEAHRIAAEDHNDVKAYLKTQEEDRRKSFENRTAAELQWKQKQQQQQQQAAEAAAASHELSYMGFLDAQEAEKTEQDRQRLSIAKGIVRARKEKEIALEKHREMLDTMHADFEHKRAGWEDARQYKRAEQADRRKSVAMRLESWRQVKVEEEKEVARKCMQNEKDRLLKEQELQDVAAAREALKNEYKIDDFVGMCF